jgi:hypothetical protein
VLELALEAISQNRGAPIAGSAGDPRG